MTADETFTATSDDPPLYVIGADEAVGDPAIYFQSGEPFRRIFFRKVPTDAFARSILWPEHPEHGVGMMCASCGTRGCVRVRPRVYWCQTCESFSLLVVGKKLAGDGLKTLPLVPEQADTDALRARLASS